MEIFDNVKPPYEEALEKCGYTLPLTYIPPRQSDNHNNNSRKWKVLWINCQLNSTVSTNVARTFLRLICTHFPCSHKVNKVFNKSTIKVSCSCLEGTTKKLKGMTQKSPKAIQKNSNIITAESQKNALSTLVWANVIYKCTSWTKCNSKEVYLGLTEGKLKKWHFFWLSNPS